MQKANITSWNDAPCLLLLQRANEHNPDMEGFAAMFYLIHIDIDMIIRHKRFSQNLLFPWSTLVLLKSWRWGS
jgi:hypothetical protein